MNGTQPPIAVGLVGAGPWASTFHAPMLAEGPETALVGVWARRQEAAEALARSHGSTAFGTFDALLDRCDAVAFAVPPDIQARLAVEAAQAGKALLLDKPLAFDVSAGRAVVDAIEQAQVGSITCLTFRFVDAVRQFVATARRAEWHGGRAVFACPAAISGPFLSPWRKERGALLDLGPHLVDLMEAVLGPVVDVRATGGALTLVQVWLAHETGATSSLVLSSAVDGLQAGVDLYGPDRIHATPLFAPGLPGAAFANLRSELAATVRQRGGHPLDAAHGLHVLELLAKAQRCLP